MTAYLKFLLVEASIVIRVGIGLNKSNGLESFGANEIVLDACFPRKTCPNDGNEHLGWYLDTSWTRAPPPHCNNVHVAKLIYTM